MAGLIQWLHAHGFRYKNPEGTLAKADPEKRTAFVAFDKDLQQQTSLEAPILFGDGVHPTMATKMTYGWIRRGKDKMIVTIASRSRLNLMGTLGLEEINLITPRHETLDSSAMEVHFQKIRNAYPRALNSLNARPWTVPYQRSNEGRCQKEEPDTAPFAALQPPNLNPIERVWKVMNEHVRNNRVFKSASECRVSTLAFFHHHLTPHCTLHAR